MATFAPAPVGDTKGAGDNRAPPLRPRETIGDLLRRTRMEYGAEIETIAAALRIRAAYLTAIEQARYDRLPGSVYALGFVRAYAAHLGLDGEEAVRRFKQEAAGLDRRRDLAFPVPLTSRSVPGGRMLLAAFVLAVCAYGIWHYLSTGDRDRPERVAAVPTALLPPAPAQATTPATSAAPPASSAASPPPAAGMDRPAPPPPASPTAVAPPAAPAGPGAASGPASPAAASTAPAPAVSAPSPAPTASAPPPAPPEPVAPVTVAELPPPAPVPAAAAAPPPAPVAPVAPDVAAAPAATPAIVEAPATTTHVFGAVDGPSHITLRAVKDCWILVRDGDPAQNVVAQRTLHAGDTYRVPDRTGLTLRTGNASGLEVLVDGKVAPALGGTVRNIALDAGRLLAGTAHLE